MDRPHRWEDSGGYIHRYTWTGSYLEARLEIDRYVGSSPVGKIEQHRKARRELYPLIGVCNACLLLYLTCGFGSGQALSCVRIGSQPPLVPLLSPSLLGRNVFVPVPRKLPGKNSKYQASLMAVV